MKYSEIAFYNLTRGMWCVGMLLLLQQCILSTQQGKLNDCSCVYIPMSRRFCFCRVCLVASTLTCCSLVKVLIDYHRNHVLVSSVCNQTLTAGFRDDQFSASSASPAHQAREARHGRGSVNRNVNRKWMHRYKDHLVGFGTDQNLKQKV